jgi:hypothetical protein
VSDEAQEVQTIRASDLVKLMGVVGAAAGLFNALELQYKWTERRPWAKEYNDLGAALRELGLAEVSEP